MCYSERRRETGSRHTASTRELHVYMGGGSYSGGVLLPDCSFCLSLCALKTKKENENGLLPGSAKQHLLILPVYTLIPQGKDPLNVFAVASIERFPAAFGVMQ